MMKIQGKVWLGLVYPHKSPSCMKQHHHKKYSGLWKTDTGFCKYLENMCYSWDLSQACLALISRHSCFDSDLHNSKKKMIKKARKKHVPSEIVKHHPIWSKNHQSGCQKQSLREAVHLVTNVLNERWKVLKPGEACLQSLNIGQAAFCSSNLGENIYLHFIGDKFFRLCSSAA